MILFFFCQNSGTSRKPKKLDSAGSLFSSVSAFNIKHTIMKVGVCILKPKDLDGIKNIHNTVCNFFEAGTFKMDRGPSLVHVLF